MEKNMTYKEFCEYTCRMAENGMWSPFDALACIEIRREIEKINVKLFGIIPLKRKTEKAREKRWQEIISEEEE